MPDYNEIHNPVTRYHGISRRLVDEAIKDWVLAGEQTRFTVSTSSETINDLEFTVKFTGSYHYNSYCWTVDIFVKNTETEAMPLGILLLSYIISRESARKVADAMR